MRIAALAFLALALALVGAGAWLSLRAPKPSDDALTLEAPARGDLGADLVLESAPPQEALDDALADPNEASELLEPARVALAPAMLVPENAAADASVPRAHVRGRANDAATGERLPHFLLRLSDAHGGVDEVATDAMGEFATSRALAAGSLTVVARDHEGRNAKRAATFVIERSEEALETPVELAIPCGPTYRLAIVPQEGLDPLLVRARLRWGDGEQQQRTDFEPLRAGDTPWVRFAPLPETIKRAEGLELRTSDGLWIGDVRVDTFRGVAPVLLRAVLEARAAIEGRAVTPEGEGVGGALALLSATTLDGTAYERRVTTRADGTFRLELLKPGTGALRIAALRHAPADALVDLRSNVVEPVELVLARLPGAGSVKGEIESETGTYAHGVRMTLAREGVKDLADVTQSTQVFWTERSGRKVGVWSFDDLPQGDYRVSANANDFFTWESRTRKVAPPDDRTVFRVLDATPVVDLVVRYADRDNGVEPPLSHLSLEVGGRRPLERFAKSGEVVLAGWPIDRTLRWRFDCRGYESRIGDLQSFAVETLVDGRAVRTLELSLRAGWGETVRVVDRKTKRPVANVALFADGKELAKTKTDGYARLFAARKPAKLEPRLKGWKLAGKVDLRRPDQRGWQRVLTIEMDGPRKK